MVPSWQPAAMSFPSRLYVQQVGVTFLPCSDRGLKTDLCFFSELRSHVRTVLGGTHKRDTLLLTKHTQKHRIYRLGSSNQMSAPESPARNIWPISTCTSFTQLLFPSDKSKHYTDTNSPSRASAVRNKHMAWVSQWARPIFHNTQPVLYRGGVIKARKRERTVDRRDGHIRKIREIAIFFPPSAEDITSAEKQTHMRCTQKMSAEMKFNVAGMDELWRRDGDLTYILTWEQNANSSFITCISK